MTKYKVVVSSVGSLTAELEVEAASSRDAEEAALSFIGFTEWKVLDVDPAETFITSIENVDDPLCYT